VTVRRVGTRVSVDSLRRRIANRTLLLAALLVALTIVEEVVVGLVHHRPAAQSLAEFFGDGLAEKLAGCLVVLLVLLPLVTVIEFRSVVGAETLSRLLLARPSSHEPED
jgi:hypothetical protein